jgi:hypothetical protein
MNQEAASGTTKTGHERSQTETSQSLDSSSLSFSSEISPAIQAVKDHNSAKQWALFGYVPKQNSLRLDEESDRPLEDCDMDDVFQQGHAQFLVAKVKVHSGNKIVLVSWAPEGLPVIKRTMAPKHTAEFEKLVQPHVTVYARNETDISFKALQDKASRAAGVKY